MAIIKHTAPKKSELEAILRNTEDPRMRALFRFLSESGRRITEVIGDGAKLKGLRLKDLQRDDDGEIVARYFILKKDARRKVYEKVRVKFFTKYGNTPQSRTAWTKRLRELRREKHEYGQKELPISKRMLRLLYRVKKRYDMTPEDRFFPFLYHECRYRFEKAQKIANVEYATTPRKTKDKTKDATLYHLHQLRHFYATQIARNTKNVTQMMELKKLMQHENIAVTQHYIDADDRGARN